MSKKITSLIWKNIRIIMLLLIIAGFALATPKMLTVNNLSNVITQQAPFIILYSIGMTLAIVTKGIDVSVGSVVALTSCLAAYFIKSGHIITGVIISLGVGIACGAVNGFLITKVKLSPFIATYGMDWVVRGIAYIFMGGVMISGLDPGFRAIAVGSVLGIPNLIIIAVLIVAVMVVLTTQTTFGRNLFATGTNPEATRLSGVNTDRIILTVYTIGGLMAAVAGLLYIARLNAAEAVIGQGFALQAMAAVLIGGTSFQGGKGGIGNTVIGALIMVFITNGMNLIGVSNLLQDGVIGLIIILSAALEKISQTMILKAEEVS